MMSGLKNIPFEVVSLGVCPLGIMRGCRDVVHWYFHHFKIKRRKLETTYIHIKRRNGCQVNYAIFKLWNTGETVQENGKSMKIS